MKHRLPIVLSLLVFVSNAVFGADSARDQVRIWVEQNVPEMMREAHMPGFSIAVVQDGATIYAEGFGARDPAQGLPATPDTLYGIGSITKSFVALAILQLEEQGRLKLEDAVSTYVPFGLGMPGKPITIWHLLTHTPGFPSLATSNVLLGRGLGEDTGVPMGTPLTSSGSSTVRRTR
jgi:CubicO group peptidase (beta-lactamase class C family)